MMTKNESTGFATIDSYKFIVQWAADHKGNTPSQRQVGAACGFSSATAHYHIQVLIKEGLLERKDGELCVVRSTFTPWNNVFEIEAEQAHPVFEEMQVIPKDIRGIEYEQLESIGIHTNGVLDNEFLKATYPESWRYIASKARPGRWFLADDNDDTIAVLIFDQHHYAAYISFP